MTQPDATRKVDTVPTPFAHASIVADRPDPPARTDKEPRPISAEPSVRLRRNSRVDRSLVLILLIAWALRIAVIRIWPNIQWPDEIYQALEPAHRLVFGYGILSWEWQAGIRSLVLPGLFAAPMELARWLGAGAGAYLALIEALLCALSLSVVWTSYRLGGDGDSSGDARFGAMVAAAPAALWLELVLFAPHAFSDSIAAHFLVPGLYFLQLAQVGPPVSQKQRSWRAKSDVAAGALLAFAIALRPAALALPLVPALLLTLGSARHRWIRFLLGAIPVVLAYGAADVLQGQWPLQSTLRQATLLLAVAANSNLVGPGSANFYAPWNYYSSIIVGHWGGALPFLLILLFLGMKRGALWLIVAAGILVELSALPHKEYRYIYPAIACLMPVLGLGTARLAAVVATLWQRRDSRAAVVRITWLVTAVCSAALARQPAFADEWFRSAAAVRSFVALREDPSVCGVGLLDGVSLTYMPGYVWLHREVPLREKIADAQAVAAELSDLLASGPRSDLPAEYVLDRCWTGTPGGFGGPAMICRYHRPGPCAPSQAR